LFIVWCRLKPFEAALKQSFGKKDMDIMDDMGVSKLSAYVFFFFK